MPCKEVNVEKRELDNSIQYEGFPEQSCIVSDLDTVRVGENHTKSPLEDLLPNLDNAKMKSPTVCLLQSQFLT